MGMISETGMAVKIGKRAKMDSPYGNVDGLIGYRQGIGFYVGDYAVEDDDVIRIFETAEAEDSGLSHSYRVRFHHDGLRGDDPDLPGKPGKDGKNT